MNVNCNSILYGMPDTILSDLQRIQNTAARILTKCGDRNHPSINLLKKLHWLPVRQRMMQGGGRHIMICSRAIT